LAGLNFENKMKGGYNEIDTPLKTKWPALLMMLTGR
jgi:hypothetical protein